MDMQARTENDAVIETVKTLYQPSMQALKVDSMQGNVPFLLVPSGIQRIPIHESEVDEARGAPRRRKGTIQVLSIEAFIDLVNRHKSDSTVVYSNDSRTEFVAVHNDHLPSACAEPGFRDHRILYAGQLSEEWRSWMGGDGKGMDQSSFAAHLEDHVLDLLDPTSIGPETQKIVDALGVSVACPAVLRGLARDLSVRIKQQVREARNLATGETQVVFASEHATEDGRPLLVPGAFVIGIPVFEHGPLYALVARLRYRISNGTIVWSYSLAHPGNAKRDVWQGMIAVVREKTGALVVEGTP